MKVQNNLLRKPSLLLPGEKEVNKLKRNWQKCLPVSLGDLFTVETDTGIERIDTFKLEEWHVTKLKEMNNANGGNNVKTISVIMGKKDKEGDEDSNFALPSNSMFVPILKVNLYQPYHENETYYFILEQHFPKFNLYDSRKFKYDTGKCTISKDGDQHLSPKVAELFIMKWQAMGDAELVCAFDCLAPESADEKRESKWNYNVSFGRQKLFRVRQYNYDSVETNAIFRNMNLIKDVDFFISLGAGLAVADFHPFSFRPIVRIEEARFPKDITENISRDVDIEIPPTFYDTSRPCPPFCGEES